MVEEGSLEGAGELIGQRRGWSPQARASVSDRYKLAVKPKPSAVVGFVEL